MSEEESTLNLQALQDEVKRIGAVVPWRLTFSYGRALQSATLKVNTVLVINLTECTYPFCGHI
jgi:fructose-bisphosphate aldolase class 1